MSGINPEIAGFFTDPDASDAIVLAANQVVAPVIQGVPLTMNETGMGGGVRVVYFIFDASPSMEPVANLLREGFNVDFMPAVKEAREDDISALRIGGAAFSSGPPQPMWRGADDNYFHPIDKLPQLTSSDYNPSNGWGTDLHRAIIDGSAVTFSYAAGLADQGMNADVDIIILSDGADNGSRPAAEVKQLVKGRDATRVRYVFLYFETILGLSTTRPANGLSELERYVVEELGFDGEQVVAFARKPGETDEEMRHRFRLLMRVFSKISASKNTSAVMATAAVLEDDELI